MVHGEDEYKRAPTSKNSPSYYLRDKNNEP